MTERSAADDPLLDRNVMHDERKRWRFWVTDWDDNTTYVDAHGGPDGDEPEAEFIGTGHEAISEGDRRAALWETATGNIAAKITRESRGSA